MLSFHGMPSSKGTLLITRVTGHFLQKFWKTFLGTKKNPLSHNPTTGKSEPRHLGCYAHNGSSRRQEAHFSCEQTRANWRRRLNRFHRTDAPPPRRRLAALAKG
jgi:hypothetical protein